MLGISGAEFFVIILVAVIVVGPQRLPEYTRQLTRMVRQLRLFLDNARSQIAEEVGPELADLDLSTLDPRQYDPRKIVREALGEDIEAIRKDLTQPFRSVAEAAKESSEAAAKAVNDAVEQDRANSLGKQISKRRDEARSASAAGAASAAGTGTGSSAGGQEARAGDEGAQGDGAQGAVVDSAQEAGAGQGDDADPGARGPEAAGGTGDAAESTEEGEKSTEEGAEAAGRDGAGEDSRAAEAEPQGTRVAAVPSSLEPAGATGPDAAPAQSSESSESSRSAELVAGMPVRPLSPRDIVRAANEAARTRAEAAGATIEA